MTIINKVFSSLLIISAGLISSGCLPQVDIDPVAVEFNCDAGDPLAVPEDLGASGPWAVGRYQTVLSRGDFLAPLVTEVWYPAMLGSEQGHSTYRYDIRRFLKPEDAARLPDSEDPFLDCNCYNGLPLDTQHGKFPVIVYVHGTGGFAEVSISQMTHWASRGFVVIAANHPEIQLQDILAKGVLSVLLASQDLDLKFLIAEVHKPDVLTMFADVMDNHRIGVIGHSAGAIALNNAAKLPGVRAIIPMAGNKAIAAGPYASSVTFMGALDDNVVPYSGQQRSFEASNVATQRLLGIENAGHMTFSDICGIRQSEGGIFAIAAQYDIEIPAIIKRFASDGCSLDQIAPQTAIELVNYVTTGVFEETLQCSDTAAAQLDLTQSRFVNAITFEQR